ncbi:MAG: MBL fold metallo-hydrolase [Bacilli bacterium]
MRIQTFSMGPIGTSCCVVYNEHKEAIIFDPSGSKTAVVQFLKEEQLQPLAILLTHAHWDHIWGLQDMVEHFDIPIYIHKKERMWLKDASLNGSSRFGLPTLSLDLPTNVVDCNAPLHIGHFHIQCLHLPGHSPGSVGYYFSAASLIVSGDVLFEGSVGRTDLAGGNVDVLAQSIVSLFEQCPSQTRVYPGHGMPTTLEKEQRWNPYVGQFLR